MTNIVTARISSGRTVKTRALYQYDYGQVLVPVGVQLPVSYEVHFSNTEKGGQTVTQVGSENGVSIPDALLLSGKPVYAWIFLHTGEDDGETVYQVNIPVTPRSQPTGNTPTPVQHDAITQAIAALNAGVERSETAADEAEQSADGASGNADRAETAAESAELAKETAVAAKTRAVEAEEIAERHADDAATSATNADQRATDAQTAQTAQTAAETAQGKAEDAQAAAEAALAEFTSITASAETLTPGSDATAEYEDGHLTFGIPRGESGVTPDISIGTVETLDPGEAATASITGTAENPVLNLGIPQGPAGADYVLTSQDKQDIADIVLSELPTAVGVNF